MKFTSGFWWLREGIQPLFPCEVREVERTEDRLNVYAPVRDTSERGATVNCPMLSIEFSSPMDDVIRVKISHFKGIRREGPEFEITENDADVRIEEGPDELIFSSGNLSAHVARDGEWKIEFRHGDRTLTNSMYKNMGHMTDTNTGKTYMKDELGIGVGECIYGLGERFTPFVKNGQVIDMWNNDGGTASEIAYKNIPLYLSSRGYGVFVNHPEKVSFEVGSEKVTRAGFAVEGECLEYFVINGPSLADVLDRYTALTGRPALPPQWTFGLWLTTSFTTDYDEETVTGFIEGMKERDLPLHVFHFDCFWMKGFHWIDLEWDPDIFPEPAAMLARLKALGVKICVWINPYVAQRSAMFNEAMEMGYLLRKANGDIYQRDRWQAGNGLIDFTNQDACQWYVDRLGTLVDMGVDSFKTDFGEEIPVDVVYHDGSDPMKMHNYYTYLYNRTVFEVLESKLGKGEAAVFARSATVGGQKFPVHWGGDCVATFESMAESLRGGLSLGLSGFGFWSHDMGGFETTASPDIYKRWVAFGCLSSHSRLHGSKTYRVPWLYDEESVDVLRHFIKLKCRLMPYIYQKAVEAHRRGTPVMRAMCIEFQDNPGCVQLDRQYMLGEALLVAPVMDESGTVDYFLPEGTWTDLLTDEVKHGGGWRRGTYDYMSLPLFARENSVVPMGAEDSLPDYNLAEGVTFHVFHPRDGATISTEVPGSDGEPATVLTVSRNGDTLTITPERVAGKWSVLLRSVEGVSTVSGGTQEVLETGVLVVPDSLGDEIAVVLGG